MEVQLARSAGFCFGVKRAVETVYEQIAEQKKREEEGKSTLPIYTFGPIIHNEQVVEDLASKGVRVIDTLEECRDTERGIMIIRSHGVARSVYEELDRMGFTVVDATCPFVKKIHNIVEKESREGSKILIVGNKDHPEVEGIRGWCREEAACIEDTEQAKKVRYPEGTKVCLVSQTTFNHKKFKECVEIVKNNVYNTNVADTICNATEERQTEARELASRADVMIVIGGSHSSNSRKLYEICREQCENTYFIQTLDDLHLELPKAARLVGITAGASTPNNIIEEVQSYVRRNF